MRRRRYRTPPETTSVCVDPRVSSRTAVARNDRGVLTMQPNDGRSMKSRVAPAGMSVVPGGGASSGRGIVIDGPTFVPSIRWTVTLSSVSGWTPAVTAKRNDESNPTPAAQGVLTIGASTSGAGETTALLVKEDAREINVAGPESSQAATPNPSKIPSAVPTQGRGF